MKVWRLTTTVLEDPIGALSMLFIRFGTLTGTTEVAMVTGTEEAKAL